MQQLTRLCDGNVLATRGGGTTLARERTCLSRRTNVRKYLLQVLSRQETYVHSTRLK